MKKAILTLLAIATLTSVSARANTEGQLARAPWECALTFHAKGGGLQLIVGSYKLVGKGTIRCVDLVGNNQDMDVKITMGAAPVALNVAVGRLELAGVSSGIGVASGPEALLGTYYMASAEAGVIIGVGTNVTVHGGSEALTLNLGVNVVRGTGLQLGLNRMKIEALN